MRESPHLPAQKLEEIDLAVARAECLMRGLRERLLQLLTGGLAIEFGLREGDERIELDTACGCCSDRLHCTPRRGGDDSLARTCLSGHTVRAGHPGNRICLGSAIIAPNARNLDIFRPVPEAAALEDK
jgi:hypothetical protein